MAQKILQLAPQTVPIEDDILQTLQQANSRDATLDLHEIFDSNELSSRWDEIANTWDA